MTAASSILLPAPSAPWPLDGGAAQTVTAEARRLLVVVPDPWVPEAALAQRVGALAAAAEAAVLYLGAAHDAASEAAARRQLAGLAALTRSQSLDVSTRLAFGREWPAVVQAAWQPGDVLLCLAGHEVPVGRLGVRHASAGAGLARSLDRPVVLLALPGWPAARAPGAARAIAQLAVAAALVGGFFWLQVLVSRAAPAGLAGGLVLLTVLAEYGLIWLFRGLWAGGAPHDGDRPRGR